MIDGSVFGKRLHHLRPKAADGAFLDGDQDFVFARKSQHEVAVEGFRKTCIRNSCR